MYNAFTKSYEATIILISVPGMWRLSQLTTVNVHQTSSGYNGNNYTVFSEDETLLTINEEVPDSFWRGGANRGFIFDGIENTGKKVNKNHRFTVDIRSGWRNIFSKQCLSHRPFMYQYYNNAKPNIDYKLRVSPVLFKCILTVLHAYFKVENIRRTKKLLRTSVSCTVSQLAVAYFLRGQAIPITDCTYFLCK